MGTRRITYASALIGSALFYVLYSHWFSWYLLVLLMLLMPFDLALSLPGMLTRKIALAAPNVLEQGADAVLTVTTIAEKPFPARYVKAWLMVLCDDFAKMCRLICGAERGSRYEVAIDSSRSGLTVFTVKRIWTISLIGLFSMPATAGCRAAVLVLPAPVKPKNIIALSRGVILRPKPGGGFSEDYDLRRYRPGDPVKSIHWKVSAKFDAIIIREPLVPPLHSRLVHVAKWEDAGQRDLILGRLRWVSDYLLKWEMPYYVRIGEEGPVAEVTNAADLIDYIYRRLDSTSQAVPAPPSLPARFAWVFRIDVRDSAASGGQLLSDVKGA